MKKHALLSLVLILFIMTGCSRTAHPANTPSDKSEVNGERKEIIFGCEAVALDEGLNSVELSKIYLETLADGQENGYTPVIIFLDEYLEETVEYNMRKAENASAYVSSILSNDHSYGKKWLDDKYDEWMSFFGDDAEDLLMEDFVSGDDFLAFVQSGALDLMPSPSPDEDVYLLKVPTAAPYEIIAYIPFGGWNDCPDPDDMIAVCKYWYDTYGAIPSAITYDTLTFYLKEPLTERTVDSEVVKEQFAFGLDMNYQDNAWLFWWD